MTKVTAIQRHDHNGTREIGDSYHVSQNQALRLEKKRLVIIDEAGPTAENPTIGGGEQSSASQAGQASPPPTSTESGAGDSTSQQDQGAPDQTPPDQTDSRPETAPPPSEPDPEPRGKRRQRTKGGKATDKGEDSGAEA